MDTELAQARIVESILAGVPCYEYVVAQLERPNISILVLTHAPVIMFHELKSMLGLCSFARGLTAYSEERVLVTLRRSRLHCASLHPTALRIATRTSRYDLVWFPNGAEKMQLLLAQGSLTRDGKILEGHIR